LRVSSKWGHQIILDDGDHIFSVDVYQLPAVSRNTQCHLPLSAVKRHAEAAIGKAVDIAMKINTLLLA
jgi:hypothetical protein